MTQLIIQLHVDFQQRDLTYCAIIFPLLVDDSGVDSLVLGLPNPFQVVIHDLTISCQYLENFIDARCSDDGIGGGYGRNDVLHNSHGEFVGHSLNVVLQWSLQGLFIDPI